MLVRALMSSPVVTADADATLRAAVGRMLDGDVGSVVLVDGGSNGAVPAAILTTSDVLAATHDRDAPLSELSARDAASSPLETIEPDRTVGDAVDRMTGAGVRHLPVVDGFDVVGIVTATDVAVAHDDVRKEAIDLVGRRASWETEE